MRKTKFEEIALGAADLSNLATDLLEYFNGSTESGEVLFDVKRTIHGTDISYSDCLSRIATIAEISEKFDKSNRYLLVPLSRITDQNKQSTGHSKALTIFLIIFDKPLQITGGANLSITTTFTFKRTTTKTTISELFLIIFPTLLKPSLRHFFVC